MHDAVPLRLMSEAHSQKRSCLKVSFLRVISVPYWFQNCNFRKKKNPHFHFCNIFTSYFLAIIYVLTLIIIKCPKIWLCCVIICYLYNEFLLFHHLKTSALPAYLILILLSELQGDRTSWEVLFSELVTQLNVMSQASLFHIGVLKLLPELAKKAHLKWELFSSGAVAFVLV